jgi:hypothetical protein
VCSSCNDCQFEEGIPYSDTFVGESDGWPAAKALNDILVKWEFVDFRKNSFLKKLF